MRGRQEVVELVLAHAALVGRARVAALLRLADHGADVDARRILAHLREERAERVGVDLESGRVARARRKKKEDAAVKRNRLCRGRTQST